MTDPCISVVSKSGDRLIVNVPASHRDEFPQGTDVELVKVETIVTRIEESQIGD